MNRPRLPIAERFWRFTEVRGEEECWLWTGRVDGRGYGFFSDPDRHYRAHRLSWEIANGVEPVGHVCHSCDNPQCVNPRHLFLGTAGDNMRDMADAINDSGFQTLESMFEHAKYAREKPAAVAEAAQ